MALPTADLLNRLFLRLLFVSAVFAVVSNRAAIHLVHGVNEGEDDGKLLIAIVRTQLLPCLVNRTEHIKSVVWNLLDDHATAIVGVAHALHVASFFEPIYCNGNGSRGQTSQLSEPPGWHWPLVIKDIQTLHIGGIDPNLRSQRIK